MGDSHNQRNLRFTINSNLIRGSFILTFEPHIITRIQEEMDDFISSLNRKQNNDGISIKKTNNIYEINLKAFPAVCNKIFSIFKNL